MIAYINIHLPNIVVLNVLTNLIAAWSGFRATACLTRVYQSRESPLGHPWSLSHSLPPGAHPRPRASPCFLRAVDYCFLQLRGHADHDATIKSTVDLANNCNIGKRTRHANAQNHVFKDLKDEGLLLTMHVYRAKNDADFFLQRIG